MTDRRIKLTSAFDLLSHALQQQIVLVHQPSPPTGGIVINLIEQANESIMRTAYLEEEAGAAFSCIGSAHEGVVLARKLDDVGGGCFVIHRMDTAVLAGGRQ